MNKVFIALAILLILLVGCSSPKEGSVFDEDGNLSEVHADAMLNEWCNHNKGKEFAKDQCGEIWESE